LFQNVGVNGSVAFGRYSGRGKKFFLANR